MLDGAQRYGCGGEMVSLERCVSVVRRDDEEGRFSNMGGERRTLAEA